MEFYIFEHTAVGFDITLDRKWQHAHYTANDEAEALAKFFKDLGYTEDDIKEEGWKYFAKPDKDWLNKQRKWERECEEEEALWRMAIEL